jgi:peptide/nickel transport system substrate-binding protein
MSTTQFGSQRDRWTLTRRRALALMSTAAGGLLSAACAASPAAQQPVAPAPTATSAQSAASTSVAKPAAPTPVSEPRTGGTVRTGDVGDIPRLDGHQASPLQNSTTWNVYDRLVYFDYELELQAGLAESWEVDSDFKRIKLNLRRGVQFHNGREFTSDDVRWNLLRVRNPAIAAYVGSLSSQSAWWTDIQTPDKHTVILGSELPRPGLFDFFHYLNILDKDLMDGPEANTRMNGTGPMMFVEWMPGDHITFVKNPNYWLSGRPYIDGLHNRVMRDAQAMIVALEGGALDIAHLPPVADAVRLRSDPKYTVLFFDQGGSWFYVAANSTMAPTDNRTFRQALNYAIDRQRWTDTVLHGLVGAPQNLPYPQSSAAFDPVKARMYTYDLDKAKSLVAESGVSQPTIDINYATAGYASEYAQLAQIYQADLARIGVSATIRPSDNPTFSQLNSKVAYNGVILSAGAYANVSEPSATFTIGAPTWTQQGTFKDETWHRLVQQASTEPDANVRKTLYGQLNDILLDQSFVMPISLYPNISIAASNVHALRIDRSNRLTYTEMWLG